MPEPTAQYNAANPKHIKGRKNAEQRKQDEKLEAVKYVMSDKRGRHFVWVILGMSGKFTKNAFVGTSGTDYNCGMQELGRLVSNLVEESEPEKYVQMWMEEITAKTNDKKLDEANRTKGINEQAEEGEQPNV